MEPDTRWSRKKRRRKVLITGLHYEKREKKNPAGNRRFYTMAVFSGQHSNSSEKENCRKTDGKNKLSSGEFKPPSKAWRKGLTTPGFRAAWNGNDTRMLLKQQSMPDVREDRKAVPRQFLQENDEKMHRGRSYFPE